ncbi:MAG: GRP family sugar transporter [Mycoplasmataceae bacterium]|nr:GRP family sugar transporter [Mycoplasmataceae bacterium]
MWIGLLFAFLTSIVITGYTIPRKYSKESVHVYTVFFAVALLLTTLLWYGICMAFNKDLWYVGGEKHQLEWNIWELLAIGKGALFCVSIIFFNFSIDKLGLARSNQWKNLKTPIAALLMIPLLKDVTGIEILYTVIAMLLLFCAALLIETKNKALIKNKKQLTLGIMFGLGTAVLTGVHQFFTKMLTNQHYVTSQLVYTGIGILAVAIIYTLIMGRGFKPLIAGFKNSCWLPLLGGAIFFLSSLFNVIAYAHISGVVASNITQLSTVWTLVFSILVFKEINLKKDWWRISLGIVFVAAAMVANFYAV